MKFEIEKLNDAKSRSKWIIWDNDNQSYVGSKLICSDKTYLPWAWDTKKQAQQWINAWKSQMINGFVNEQGAKS